MTRLGCFFLAAATISGCLPEMNTAKVLQQVWSLPLVETGRQDLSLSYPEVWEQKVFFVSSSEGPALSYHLIDIQSGKQLWSKTDSSLHEPLYYNIEALRIGRYMCVPSNKTVQVIQLNDGRVKWRFTPAGSPMPQLSRLNDNSISQTTNDWENRETCVYAYPLHDGSARPIYRESWPDSIQVFGRTPVALNSDELFFCAIYQNSHTRKTESKWKVICLSKGQVSQQGAAYPSNDYGYGPTKQPLHYDGDIILTAFDQLVRINPHSGQEIWKSVMPRDMLSSMPLLVGNALYCALEDGFLYRLDAATGQTAWKSKLSGTPSRLIACGGQIFVVGGGDGLLYTYDAQTGRNIRSMKAPNHDFGMDAFFRRFIGMEGETGKLLLFDGHRLKAFSVHK